MRRAVHGLMILACSGWGVWAVSGERAGEQPDAASGTVDPAPPATYVGIKKCRMCHTAWHDSFLESAKANSFAALKPGERTEAKRRAKLDPDRDYTAETQCLECHALGFGRPGGYEIPKPGDPRSQRAAEVRAGVMCESCHGPGSRFVEVMADIQRQDRRYQRRELEKAGLWTVTAAVCMNCHKPDAPCHDREFCYEEVKDLAAGYHEHFPLPHRIRDGEGSGSRAENGSSAASEGPSTSPRGEARKDERGTPAKSDE
jgi:hypothetical protein